MQSKCEKSEMINTIKVYLDHKLNSILLKKNKEVLYNAVKLRGTNICNVKFLLDNSFDNNNPVSSLKNH